MHDTDTPATAIITAVVTAVGVDSTVPDNKHAVDADIALDGEDICSVTLIDGSVWGSAHHWCDEPGALDHDDIDRDQLIAAIEEAVLDAFASRPAPGTAIVERCDWTLWTTAESG